MSVPVTRRQFTVDDYARMRAAEILIEDDRVELLDGEIYVRCFRGIPSPPRSFLP